MATSFSGGPTTPATLYCPACGNPTPYDATVCSGCGSTLPGVFGIQPATPSTPVTSSPAVPVYAGFWLRLVAAFLDGLLIQVVVMPLGLVIGVAIALAGKAVNMPDQGSELVAVIGGLTLVILAGWLYEAVMESSEKQATFGKMLLGLKVTDEQGERISFARASGRHFAKYISQLTLLIGYIIAGWTSKKQALHDMIAGTLVVRR